MPAPTPFQDPIGGYTPQSDKKGLSFNERQALKQIVRSGTQGKAVTPNLDIEPAPRRKYNKDELKADIQGLSQRTIDYLKQGNRWEQRLEFASIKDISVIMGILTDKMLLLEGQPTQIMGHTQHAKVDEITQKLKDVIEQRGLGKVTLTERKVEIQQ